MPKFEVTIIESFTYSIEVAAKNENAAIEKATKKFEENKPKFFEQVDHDYNVDEVNEV